MLATKLDATLKRCLAEKAEVSTAAAVFLEDSLCSHVEALKDLNLTLGYLAVAEKHVDDPDHAVIGELVVKAQAALVEFQGGVAEALYGDSV